VPHPDCRIDLNPLPQNNAATASATRTNARGISSSTMLMAHPSTQDGLRLLVGKLSACNACEFRFGGREDLLHGEAILRGQLLEG